jgi:hypothetical protein
MKSRVFEIVSFLKKGGGGKRRMKWTIHEAYAGNMINSYKIWYKKPKGKRSLGKPGRKGKGSVKMYVQVIDCGFYLSVW